MGWNESKKAAQESGGGMFLQLKDGDRKQVVVVGEPHHFFQIYGDKTNTEYQSKVPLSSFRFKVQVVEAVGTNLEGKLWTGGKTVYERLLYLHEDMGGIGDKMLLVTRKGSTKDDTTYNIDIKTTLSADQLSKIKAVKLPPMERKEGVSSTGVPPGLPDDIPYPDDSDTVPF